MIRLSPSLLIAAAGALLDGARKVGHTARLAEQFLAGVGNQRSMAWNAAFIHHAGYWSHYDHQTGRSRWPLPPTADCELLAKFAQEKGVLSAEAPEAGEVFLLWSPVKKRFVHVGIVLWALPVDADLCEVPSFECRTIEGNVTQAGCVGGDRLARVRRLLSAARGDRVVRWAALQQRVAVTYRKAA